MNKLLFVALLGIFLSGCAAKEEVKAFHPTDDVSAQAQGGKGETSDGSEVNLTQDNSI
tara:strand:+ start:322 stop:495 length:174 start_codon:yes stop_codon:yes gene_type:complete